MIEGMTHLPLQQHPSTPKAATVTNIKYAAGSCGYPTVQKSCQEFLQKNLGTGNILADY